MQPAPTTTYTTLQISSPIRITTEAVELRDRTYPMSSVKSTQVIEVISERESWKDRLGFISLFLGILVEESFIGLYPWQSNGLLEVVPWVFGFGLVALVVAAYMRLRYVRGMKKWPRLYIASLSTTFGTTAIAASQDRAYIASIVSAVELALAGRANATQLGSRQDRAIYSTDQSVYMDDSYLYLRGVPLFPISEIRFAQVKKTEIEKPARFSTRILLGLWTGAIYGLLHALNSVYLAGWFGGALFLALIVAISAARLLKKNRDKPEVEALSTIYECSVITNTSSYIIVSIDKGYADQLTAAVNAEVRRRKAHPYTRGRITT